MFGPTKGGQPRRIVHLVEGKASPRTAKTSRGVLLYSDFESIGLIDSTNVGKTAQELFGCGGDIPAKATLGEFLEGDAPANTLIIGVTPVGGQLPEDMKKVVVEAIEHGMDIWSGLHVFLNDDPFLKELANRHGALIWDVRKPEKDLPVGHGHCLDAQSYICLFVGTDCALGKMTAALELRNHMKEKKISTEFVATGQTGMMISGWGHPVDAIPGDFMTGVVEEDCMSVDGKCEFIMVEGQGSLLHPGFSPVTLGLMHGSMPDGMILCHQPSRTRISNRERFEIPSLKTVADLYLEIQKPLKPSHIVGVCMNTYGMPEDAALAACKAAEDELQVPATDPCRFDTDALIQALVDHKKQLGKYSG